MWSDAVATAIKRNIIEEIDSVKKAWELMKSNFTNSKVQIATEVVTTDKNKITGKSTGLPESTKVIEPLLDMQKVLNNVIKANETKLTRMNEQFSTTEGLTKLITENLNAGIGEFSQKIAESIVLGKNLSETFREMAQSVLVKILQRLIEEQLTKLAILALDQISLLLEKQKTQEIIKQNALLTQQKATKGGGFFDSLLSFGSSLFGGGSTTAIDTSVISPFAEGGSVRGGEPITVGERGREVFMPKSDGTIIPSEKIGGVYIILILQSNQQMLEE
jgi:hypothetical protein